MPCRLSREEIVTIGVLAEKQETRSGIARTLGVTEGAVRYHLRRAAHGATDGRKDKPRRAAEWAEAIKTWIATKAEETDRPINVLDLYELCDSQTSFHPARLMRCDLNEVRARPSARSGGHRSDGNPPTGRGPENLPRFRRNQSSRRQNAGGARNPR